MSGHSKWSTIKRQKGAADIKRGMTFTKIANAVTIAVKMAGSGDPEANPRLRMVIEEARGVNMPKDNIQRAIDRGLGKGGEQALEEVLYEGFGPGRTAFIVEGVTDNKMRTLQEIKNIFERSGGSLAGQGSVAYMFDRKGEIKVKSQSFDDAQDDLFEPEPQSRRPERSRMGQKLKVKSKEDEMLELIDLGAEDVEEYVEDNMQKYLVYTQGSELNTMGNKITQAGFGVESQELVYKPNVLVSINDGETAKKVLDFAGRLEDMDDVQKVYANFDIDESLIAQI